MNGASFAAVVLAGGLGTRLRTAVPDLPKVLAPVAGKPFLEHLLGRLVRGGCNRLVLAVGYMSDRVMAVIGDAFLGVHVVYSVEEAPLGTGGAIRQALRMQELESAVVLNGDTWAHIDYHALLLSHSRARRAVTVAVCDVPDVGRYGAVKVSADGEIVQFEEKGNSKAGNINSGVYVVERAPLEAAALPSVFSFERDYLQARCAELRPHAFQVDDADFIDIGVPLDYARACDYFSRHPC